MTKAEQRALEKYPANKSVFDKYEKQRYAYICGYIQAEKDSELTWKDIELIVNIDKDTDNEESIIGVRKNEEHYQEVLKRFKDYKERKEK